MEVNLNSSGAFTLRVNSMWIKTKELLSIGKNVLDNVVVKVTMVFYKSFNYYAV